MNTLTSKTVAAVSVAYASADRVLGHPIGVLLERVATATVSGRARGFVPTIGQIDNYISIGRTA